MSDQDNQNPTLIKKIDELETLIRQQKEKSAERNNITRLKVGTDGIPLLEDIVTEESVTDKDQSADPLAQIDEQQINEIINRIDMDISSDLEELIKLLKNSIIDELKTDLLKELKNSKPGSN